MKNARHVLQTSRMTVTVATSLMAILASWQAQAREHFPISSKEKNEYAKEIPVDVTCSELLGRAKMQTWYPKAVEMPAMEPAMLDGAEASGPMMKAAEMEAAAAAKLMSAAEAAVKAAQDSMARATTKIAKADAIIAMDTAKSLLADAKSASAKAAEMKSIATLAKTNGVARIAAVVNARAAFEAAEKSAMEATTPEAMAIAREAMAASAEIATGKPEAEADKPAAEMAETMIEALKMRAADVRYLRLVFDALGEYPAGDYWERGKVTKGEKLMLIRHEISNCAQQSVLAARAAAALPAVVSSTSNDQLIIQSKLSVAEEDYFHVAKRTLFDTAQLSLFAGPSFSLDSGEKVETGFETLALFDGGAGSALGLGRAITEISYRTNGSVNYPGTIPPVPQVTDPPAPAITEQSLYRTDPGYARINVGYSSVLAGRYSLAVLGGLTALPGINDSFPQALRPRGEVSLLGRSFYGRGVYSRISAGYAYDTYWRNAVVANPDNLRDGTVRQKSYDRAVVQALVMLPMQGISPNFATAARLSVDTPINGRGPSEVRLSILMSMDFADFFKSLEPKKPTP